MSSESNFSFTTKVDGDLFTVRGDTFAEFTSHVSEASGSFAMSNLLNILNQEAHVSTEQAVATVTQAFPATQVISDSYNAPVTPPVQTFAPVPPPQAAAPAAPPQGVKTCAHGPMKLQPAGISKKTGNPYNAFWACQWPERAEQCKAISA
jgi:hypothetical protein